MTDFEQYNLPPTPEADLNIVSTPGGSSLREGVFKSPNYVRARSGWQLDSEGNVEFGTGIFRGDVVLGGTIRTVDSADEIQPAIDNVSASGGGSIYLASGIYNMTTHIDIPSNVYLIGASRNAVILDFGGAAFGVRSLGIVGTHITNILVKDLTIQNSSITGLKLQYNDVSLIDGVDVFNCNIGIELDNVESVGLLGMGVSCGGNGTNLKITNSSSFSVYFSSFVNSTSGHGIEISDSSSATIFDFGVADNAGDGINLTNCSDIAFISLAVSGNGGQGIELVSGNSDCQFSNGTVEDNASDGIKLTATSDNISISGTLKNNGGYGINIAAASCDNNIILAPTYEGNSSGTLNNLGTGTVVLPMTSSSVLPQMIGFATDITGSWVANVPTTAIGALYFIPATITVNKFIFEINASSAAGVLKFGLFSVDGQVRYLSLTTGTIGTPAEVVNLNAGGVIISPGFYYLVVVSVGTADLNLKAYTVSSYSNLNVITGEPVHIGTFTVTSGTMPLTFDPTAMTNANRPPVFRLDT